MKKIIFVLLPVLCFVGILSYVMDIDDYSIVGNALSWVNNFPSDSWEVIKEDARSIGSSARVFKADQSASFVDYLKSIYDIVRFVGWIVFDSVSLLANVLVWVISGPIFILVPR